MELKASLCCGPRQRCLGALALLLMTPLAVSVLASNVDPGDGLMAREAVSAPAAKCAEQPERAAPFVQRMFLCSMQAFDRTLACGEADDALRPIVPRRRAVAFRRTVSTSF